ncbi:MAG: hypothetical protein ACQETH_03350 [Candidatus Rifleibacteriota bacterium]
MRAKLFILLALFVAFSATSFAGSIATNTISIDLQENRSLEFGAGQSTVATDVTRLSNDQLAITTNWTPQIATLSIQHDLGLEQKITVETALQDGDWVGRYLTVEAGITELPAGGNPTGEINLITDGTVGPVSDLVTEIPATSGVEEVTLNYLIAAGPNASPGLHTAEVYYTLTDN